MPGRWGELRFVPGSSLHDGSLGSRLIYCSESIDATWAQEDSSCFRRGGLAFDQWRPYRLKVGMTNCTGVGSWAASQQIPETQNLLDPELLHDGTLRQIVHLSVGGSQLRVRVSNAFGTQPLHLTAVHIARPVSPGGAAIDVASDVAVMFHGAADVVIPAGADYVSDPVTFSAAALSSLAISIHFDQPPVQETGHPGSRATSYVAHGDVVSAADLPDAKKVEHWYQISGVDVVAPAKAVAVVTLGDSITDGHGATTNGNDRWPDMLAARMQGNKSTRTMGVLNEGTGGNRLLLDGLGPNALARFDRDVLAQTAVRAVIVLEGVNDLGTLTRDHDVSADEHAALVKRMEGAYAQMIERGHAHGVRGDWRNDSAVWRVEVLSSGGGERGGSGGDQCVDSRPGALRCGGGLRSDDAGTRRIRIRFCRRMTPGNGLHPSPAGYKAMANAIPLALFKR